MLNSFFNRRGTDKPIFDRNIINVVEAVYLKTIKNCCFGFCQNMDWFVKFSKISSRLNMNTIHVCSEFGQFTFSGVDARATCGYRDIYTNRHIDII